MGTLNEEQMLHSSTKGLFTCNVSLNGILKFDESVKIPGLDTFPRCISRGSVHCVRYKILNFSAYQEIAKFI